jgi:16S rRNA (cytosine967-C5)-methyltransferase
MDFARIRARLASVPWDALSDVPLEEPLTNILRGQPAERVLNRFLRQKSPPADARHAIAETLFGVGLWRRRLERRVVLAGGAPQATSLLYAFWVDIAGVAPARAGRLAGGEWPLSTAPLAFADEHSLPDWLAAELHACTGTASEAAALAEALNLPGPICLRTNTLLISRDALASRLAKEGMRVAPTEHSAVGLVAEWRPNILASPAYREGLFEVQDEGSQLVGHLVAAAPGARVLDTCAGAGGKTLRLAADVGERGCVYAFDPDGERLRRLEQRCERARATSARVLRALPDTSLEVDAVLVDAPCSELGALRRGPDVRWRMDPASFDRLPALQLRILESAARHVRPDGALVYATCTFRQAENEGVVAEFLQRNSKFRIAPLQVDVAATFHSGGMFQAWPHRHGTDGFFAARLCGH